MTKQPIIQVSGIHKQFGNKVAIQDVSFNVQQGEIFGLLGPNGAGKTTIIRMMTTLLHQNAGNILLNGFNTLSQGRLARQQFSVTGQASAIDQDLSARENLMIFGKLNGLNRSAAQARTNELLTDFDLIHSANQTLATFSGGMRRRLDLAVSLIGMPPILFLDEPTTGLDPRTRTQMWQAIRKLVANGSTVLLTTQYLEEADHLADRIALIDHGQLKAIGTPDELKQQVGGMELRLEVSDSHWVKLAATIVKNAVALPTHINNRTLTVLLGQSKLSTASHILNQLQEEKIPIKHFSFETPSLDDVFLKMTVGKN